MNEQGSYSYWDVIKDMQNWNWDTKFSACREYKMNEYYSGYLSSQEKDILADFFHNQRISILFSSAVIVHCTFCVEWFHLMNLERGHLQWHNATKWGKTIVTALPLYQQFVYF